MLDVKNYDAPELLGELVLFEISPDYCRETAAIKAASAEIPLGTVLMKNDDGTLSPWAPAAAGDTLEEGAPWTPSSAATARSTSLKQSVLPAYGKSPAHILCAGLFLKKTRC